MKILLLVFLSTSAFAQHKPQWNHGEIKITYPCDVIEKLPKKKEKKQEITFFDKEKLPYFESGLIFRKRAGKKGDFTVKYRSKNSDVVLDKKLFEQLSHTLQGELECEFDMTYHPTNPGIVYSCGFKSETLLALPFHKDFIKMMGVTVPEWSLDLKDMKAFTVESSSWKYDLSKFQKQFNPFTKAPKIEKWITRGECRAELSGKMDIPVSDPKTFPKSLSKAFDYLKSLVPAKPSEDQGNKTNWVLSVK